MRKKKSHKRLWGWAIILVLSGGALYLLATYPIQGRTLFDRALARRPSLPLSTFTPPLSTSSDETSYSTDMHTDQDRENLKRIIETKLKENN